MIALFIEFISVILLAYMWYRKWGGEVGGGGGLEKDLNEAKFLHTR